MSLIYDYIATLTPEQRVEFLRIRRIVESAVPTAGEAMSYGMAAFTYRGKPFLSFKATQKHLSLYPYSGKVIVKLQHKLSEFGTSSGTIRFNEAKPLPEALLQEIIAARLLEIDESITKATSKPRVAVRAK